MRKFILSSLVIFFCLFNFSNIVKSQEIQQEKISNFDVVVSVNNDSSINVKEKIQYDSGALSKHGIYRYINLSSFGNKILKISDINITDENGIPYNFVRTDSWKKINLKIGKEDEIFVGEKIYVIEYKILGALGFFKDFDEIYWNVTGNDWLFPIERVSVLVNIPSGAKLLQTSNYCGKVGSNEKCQTYKSNQFLYNNTLLPGEGMTVAVGFSKGFVKETFFLVSNIWSILSFIIPIVIFILAFLLWRKYGRDPKSNRTIIAEYDVPDNLTPLEVISIIKGKISSKNISAEIIFLAVKGYIKIEAIEQKKFFIKSRDYTIKKIKDIKIENKTDKELFDFLFDDDLEKVDEIKISDLKNRFGKNIPVLKRTLFMDIVSRGYFKTNPNSVVAIYLIVFVLIGVFIGFNFLYIVNNLGILFLVNIIFVDFIILFFGFLMPARTEKGLRTTEYLLGFKQYLSIAEKDRINFHNAPEKKPETFEKFLPYAMVLGVEKKWAEEFKDVYIENPKWYTDNNLSKFNSILFISSLENLTSDINHSIGISGSYGGGSSGGGGGGGGGGSW